MKPNEQQDAFRARQKKAAGGRLHSAFSGRDLAMIGESLCCYVPRLVRHLGFEQLLVMPYAEIERLYGADSWAVDDLIRLLERIADEAGTNDYASDLGFSFGGSESAAGDVSAVPANSPVSPRVAEASDEAGAAPSEEETVSVTADDTMQAEFGELCQVLELHPSHQLLEEKLCEFLEAGDTDLPLGFLGCTVREVLERPFSSWLRRWIGHKEVRCLLTLLDRAVTSIRSAIAGSDAEADVVPHPLRRRNDSVPRERHVDGKSWRLWCDVIRNARLQRLKLGQITESLRDLPSGLWDQPLTNFITSPLETLAEVPGIGPTRFDLVVAAVRDLALELLDLPLGTNARLKFIPGPLRSAQDWIERTLESRVVPDLYELTVQLLRPLAWQLQHDLADREAHIAIHRLQLDESSSKSTLEDLAAVHGVSRERIRQLEQWGPRVLQIRFPQGRYLLDALHGQLAAVPGAEPQAKFVRRIATLCFESEIAPLMTSNEVAVAWDEAGRLKLTPMTSEQISEWSRNRLPMFAPNAVLEAIRSRSLCLQLDGQAAQWFTRTEIDRILFTLFQQRGPVRLGELVLFDRIQNDPALTDGEQTENLDSEDERSLWGRIRRDPRFVECGDHHLLLPSESCGFERLDGQWMIRLVSDGESNGKGDRRIAVVALAKLLADELRQRGIVDATAWGVHRFAGELIAKMFRACLPEAITPHVLADMLVKLSGGLIRTMRRRRLRWDQEILGVSVRGKRGWVGHVVAEFGQPMLLSELADRLRDYYQDYADHVVNQLTTITDEDGEIDDRAQFVTGLGQRVPIVVIPTNWALDSTHDNVSDGVAKVARRLARQVKSERLALDELESVGWLRQLVEHSIESRTYLKQDAVDMDEENGPEYATEANMYPIKITRIGATSLNKPHHISAFIRVHGSKANGMLDHNQGPFNCDHCGWRIEEGKSFAIENVESSIRQRRKFENGDRMRCWCLPCIDYFSIEDEERRSLVQTQINNEFNRILQNAPTHRPWSLAELGVTQPDIERLIGLFEQTGIEDLRSFLSRKSQFAGYSQEAVLGALLLLLESELARRHASEGRLWSAIHQQVTWRRGADRFLFTERRPNSRHKSYLETAAKELGLRCAFGEDSAQEWYQSVFLQCGFSKKSFEGRLPQWLAGESTPVSVARLLSSDARYGSSSFAALWTALRDFRQGSLDRPGLKAALESSPWVLQEWHDSLMQLSRAESHSSTATDGQVDVSGSGSKLPASGDSGATTSERRFLSEPRLRWSNETLQFVCSVVLSDGLELEDDADIVIDGQVRSRLILQTDGSFDATPNEIELPTSSPTSVVELKSVSEITLATQSLALWDDDDDVAGYVVKTGRRIDPWSREFSQRETLLIYSADLRIEPARPTVAVLGNGSRHVVRLLPQETVNTRLFLGTELLWEPDAPTYPAWRDRVHADVELRPRESPTQFRVCVSHPGEVTATAVRFRRNLLDLKHDSANRSNSDWLPLDSELRIAEVIAFTVLLRMGDEKTELRRRIPWRLPGHLWRREDRWEAIPTRTICEIRELRQTDFRLSPPESEIKGDRWQLFEGRRWIDSVRDRPQRITAVDGWGAPLVLRAAPYNCCQPEQPLLEGLTDQGEIREVEFGPDGAVTISLHRPIEPDESHAVVVLDEHGEMTFIEKVELAAIRRDDSTSTNWKLSLLRLAKNCRVVAVAIAYNGERLGSWWQHDWTDALRRQAGLADNEVSSWASDVADAMRWFHLPILSRDNASQIGEFAKSFAVPVLAAWLNQRTSRRLIHDAVGEGWLCAVRAIFSDWLPSIDEAERLDVSLETAMSDGKAPWLTTTVTALRAVNPLLAARFIRASLKSERFKSAKAHELRALMASIRMQIVKSDSVDSLVSRVAQDVARTDEPPEGTLYFVRESLLAKSLLLIERHDTHDVTELDRSNIEVAMRLDAFRSLVLVACLERIIKELV